MQAWPIEVGYFQEAFEIYLKEKNQNTPILLQENEFANVVCMMSTI